MKPVTVLPLLLKHRIDKRGLCPIAVRIVKDRRVLATKTTGYKVPPMSWDDAAKRVTLREPNYVTINAMLKRIISDYEMEFMRSELLGIHVTKERVMKVLNGGGVTTDYYSYCEQVIAVKYNKKETKRQHLSELTKLRQFSPSLHFSDIDFNFLNRYRSWMIKARGNTDNTAWKSLKAMYAMVNHAMKEGLLAENPFKNFDRGKYVQGRREYLELSELNQIEALLQTNIPERLKLVGYYYLFMCYTGLRYNDATMFFNAKKHIIQGERIVMVTEKWGTVVDIYIHKRLRPVLAYVSANPIKMLNQDFNAEMKQIALLTGINKKLTAHTARHTFGAALAEMDVPIEKAQLLLGHKDIDSTKIYYHIKNKSLDKEIQKFDNFNL